VDASLFLCANLSGQPDPEYLLEDIAEMSRPVAGSPRSSRSRTAYFPVHILKEVIGIVCVSDCLLARLCYVESAAGDELKLVEG
jgi:hypothetical protein